MGQVRSTMSGNERELEEEEDDPLSSTGGHRYNLRSRNTQGQRSNDQDGEQDTEAELSSIVAYLIRSGQIRFREGDTDSDDDFDVNDMAFIHPPQQPEVDANPNTDKLKKSDIYAHVMRSSGRWSDHRWLSMLNPTIPNILAKRELGLNTPHSFPRGELCLLNARYLPTKMRKVQQYGHKVFCGSYSANGEVFLSASQDQHIRLYNTAGENFERLKVIKARDVGWSVLDTAFSPDGCYAAYSSWSDCIHLCNLFGEHEIHQSLNMDPGDHSFAIFSLMFSSDNKEILGGANDGNIYVYDREVNQRTWKIDAHDDDVNTVCFADDSSQILYSGSDDGLCKVWDRRTLREENPVPVGSLAGHSDGITHVCSKGDARYLISNSKDQTLKLWDVRCFSDKAAIEETKKAVSSQRWDYRWQTVPKRMRAKKELVGDSSVMTYRGHCVLHTLIRCKFSPEFTTGQRYVYTGCSTGRVMVYDLLTGKVVRRLSGHLQCTRDVAWHPYKNEIVSSSWDGALGLWYYHDFDAYEKEPGEEETVCGKSDQNNSSLNRTERNEALFAGLFD